MAFPDLELLPFFQWLFRTSVQASVLVCLILAVQAVLRRRLSARWHYCLWLLLLVRLVMPGAPESSLSVFNLMSFGQERQAAVAPEVIVLGRTEPAEPASLSMPAPVPLLPGQLDGEAIRAQRAPFRVQPVPLIWAFGALLVAIYAIGQNVALSSRVARQRQITDEGVLGLLENCKETMGVRAYLSVVETPRVKSPALLGFIRPRLLLPEGMVETIDRGELRYVFLHELAHLKRRDIAVNWLMAALQLMHWFNPLIWYAFYRMRADREIACDALVLSRTQPGESKSYGRTIVSLLERFSQARRLPGLAGIVEDKSQIKRRITMIALFKRDSLLRSVVSLVLLAALGCVALTDARGAPEGATGDARDTVFVANDEEQADRDEKMEEMEEKLDTVVSLDFSKGTDIRDIVEFVSDFASVNVILDERVMLPPPEYPTFAGEDTIPRIPGAIEPSVPSEMHRVYVTSMSLRNALEAAFKPAGLEYVVQPDFIWLSTPDVLRTETFPPVESRMTVPSGSGERKDELIDQVGAMAARLGTNVSLDFREGTDIRDVLSFLCDFARVNIVLDERVMLPGKPPRSATTGYTPGGAPPPPRPTLERSARPPVDGIHQTVRSEVRRVYLNQISLGDALAVMVKQWGLDYRILPEHIWVSRPDVLKKETFRAVETRIRSPQEEGDVDAANAKLEKMREKLQERVSLDFVRTDLRDVFQFLADFTGVNIVVDERVILAADGTTAKPVAGIEPTIDRHIRRIYLLDISLGEALIAICNQMGLDYAVTPEFVWISTPAVLRSELPETKTEVNPEVSELLDVGVRLYADGHYRDALDRFSRALVIDPENKIARKYAEECTQQVTPGRAGDDVDVEYPLMRFRPFARADPEAEPEEKMSTIDQIRKIDKNLRETTVTAHYMAGANVRNVLSYLADSLKVNIVLDERVMLDSALPPETEAVTPAKRPIEPSVQSEIADMHFEDTPGDKVLKASLEPMGLAYKVQPDFIWVSSPDILRNETFEPLETRYYILRDSYSAKKILARLREEIPDILEPYTGETLSYMDLSPTTNLLIIHNTPSNFEIIEKILEREDQARPLEWRQTRNPGGSDPNAKTLRTHLFIIVKGEVDNSVRPSGWAPAPPPSCCGPLQWAIC